MNTNLLLQPTAVGVLHDQANLITLLHLDVETNPHNSENTKDLVQLIADSNKLLQRVIRDGETLLRLERFDLQVELGITVNMMARCFPSQKWRLVAAEGDYPLYYDRSLFIGAIINLLKNAREASSLGGEIIIAYHKEGMHSIVLCIMDQGKGFPPEFVGPWKGPCPTTKGATRGEGLKHTEMCLRPWGATLEFSNRPTGGACVKMRMPLAV